MKGKTVDFIVTNMCVQAMYSIHQQMYVGMFYANTN